jgi:signal transduction histidine kinase
MDALQQSQRQPKPSRNSISARNATQLVSSDVELRQEHEQLDSFLSRTNENLRQPLTNIKTAIHLLRIALDRDVNLSSAQRQSKIALSLHALQEECDRAIDLIDEFTSSPTLKNSLRELAASYELLALHRVSVHCPKCASCEISKNGYRHGKQSYLCKECSKQFLLW